MGIPSKKKKKHKKVAVDASQVTVQVEQGSTVARQTELQRLQNIEEQYNSLLEERRNESTLTGPHTEEALYSQITDLEEMLEQSKDDAQKSEHMFLEKLKRAEDKNAELQYEIENLKRSLKQ